MVFTAILFFTSIAIAQTTIEVQILDGADDAEEIRTAIDPTDVTGDVSITSSDLELAFDKEPQFVGMIFRGCDIPVGAIISNAYVQFTVDKAVEGTTDQPITLEVYGAKEAAVAGPFTGDLFSVSSHPATDAKIAEWKPGISVAEGDAGENERTPDISAIITEIISLDGWASGNNIMIVVAAPADLKDDVNREMESADGDAAGAPKLVVTFTSWPAGINPNEKFSKSIYPNPTEGMFSIENPSTDKFGYEIYSINGKLLVSRNNISGSTVEVDLSSFAKGMYFVDVKTTGRTETHKLIIK